MTPQVHPAKPAVRTSRPCAGNTTAPRLTTTEALLITGAGPTPSSNPAPSSGAARWDWCSSATPTAPPTSPPTPGPTGHRRASEIDPAPDPTTVVGPKAC